MDDRAAHVKARVRTVGGAHVLQPGADSTENAAAIIFSVRFRCAHGRLADPDVFRPTRYDSLSGVLHMKLRLIPAAAVVLLGACSELPTEPRVDTASSTRRVPGRAEMRCTVDV